MKIIRLTGKLEQQFIEFINEYERDTNLTCDSNEEAVLILLAIKSYNQENSTKALEFLASKIKERT